jgi:TolA-binding protein
MEPEGAAFLGRVGGLWEQYQRVILGVVAGLVVLGGALYFHTKTRAAQEEQASGRLAEASILFWQGDYPRSLEMAKQVYTQYGSVPSGIEAHRLAGDNAYWNGDFPTAVSEYRRYLDKVKSGDLAHAAKRSLAYALESERKPLEAGKVYDELVGKLDRTSSAEFLIAAARCYRDAGKRDQAIQRLQRVDQDFGDTPYAVMARLQLGELQAAAAR